MYKDNNRTKKIYMYIFFVRLLSLYIYDYIYDYTIIYIIYSNLLSFFQTSLFKETMLKLFFIYFLFLLIIIYLYT